MFTSLDEALQFEKERHLRGIFSWVENIHSCATCFVRIEVSFRQHTAKKHLEILLQTSQKIETQNRQCFCPGEQKTLGIFLHVFNLFQRYIGTGILGKADLQL